MKKSVEIDALQALRAVAATAVVFHHAFRAVTIYRPKDIKLPVSAYWPGEQWVNLGASGVDVFFLLSGFLMIYIAGPYVRGERPPIDFLLKRFLRIWPLYALFTCFGILEAVLKTYTTGLLSFDLSPLRLMGLFFIPSLNETGQLAPIVGIGWTLIYEALFYLCFALVLRIAPKRPVIILAVILGALYVAGELMLPTAAGRLLHNDIVFEFLLGAAVAQIVLTRGFWPTHGYAWVSAGIIGFVAFSFFGGNLPRLLTGGVPATAILIGALALDRGGTWRWLVGLGNASYALYLSHIFLTSHLPKPLLYALANSVLARHAVVLSALLTIAICIAVAIAIHALVEKPIMRWLKQNTDGFFRAAAERVS